MMKLTMQKVPWTISGTARRKDHVLIPHATSWAVDLLLSHGHSGQLLHSCGLPLPHPGKVRGKKARQECESGWSQLEGQEPLLTSGVLWPCNASFLLDGLHEKTSASSPYVCHNNDHPTFMYSSCGRFSETMVLASTSQFAAVKFICTGHC